MKTLVFLALLTISAQSFASATVANSTAYVIAEAIYSTAIPVVSTGATTAVSQGQRKEALQMKNDIQDYYQAGVLSLDLQDKIMLAKKVDSSLSLNESLDALTEAANIILEQ